METSDALLLKSIGRSDLGSDLYVPSQVLLDKQTRYLSSTTTSGVFTEKYASWLLKRINTHLFSLNESGIEFTASVTSTDTAYDSSTQIALKNSILSMITGIRMLVNGTQILNEQDIQALNNLRLLTGYTSDFANTKANQLGIFQDDQNNLITQSIVDSASGTDVTGTAIVPVKVASPPFSEVINSNAANKGFMRRLQYMTVRKIATVSGTIYYKCYVPLKYISKFFETYIQPIRDAEVELYIDFDYSNTTGKYFPIQHASGVSDCTIQITSDYLGGANFVYKHLTLNATGLQKYADALHNGLNTRFDFESILSCQRVITNSTDTSFEFQAAASCPRFVRMWMLIVPTGAWASQSNVNPLHCLELPTKFNYEIQQVQQLDRDMTSPREFYESAVTANRQLEEYDDDATVNMSESEFMNLYKFVCVPLYRVKTEANRTSLGKNLQVQFTRASSTACDVYIILEQMLSANIQQANGLFSMQISRSL